MNTEIDLYQQASYNIFYRWTWLKNQKSSLKFNNC